MTLQDKADSASASTVALSGFSWLLHHLNDLSMTYMPLITAFGVIFGALITSWYYWQLINQKKRDRMLAHKRMEHEILLAKMRGGKDDEAN